MARKGKQVNLSSAMEALVTKLDRSSGGAYEQIRVRAAWEQVAGPAATQHTTGAHLSKGELVVFVDSSVWAAELSALAGPYMEAINERLGQEVVRSVRFSVSRKVMDERRIREEEDASADDLTRDDVEALPLTQSELADAERAVGTIEDEELRAAVLRAMVADLEWKKGLKARKEREAARGDL